jgi:hypothetical protein
MQVLIGASMAVLLLVLLGALIGLLLPTTFVVERSTLIDAPPAAIHPYVSTLRTWPEWTAWNTATYPDLQYSLTGPESGIGAIQTWTDPGMGNGRLEIVESDVESGIRFRLDFEGSPHPLWGTIRYAAEADGRTRVTWTGTGELGKNPLSRYMGLLLDTLIGTDYELGLQGLRNLVESAQTEPETEPSARTAEPPASDPSPPGS